MKREIYDSSDDKKLRQIHDCLIDIVVASNEKRCWVASHERDFFIVFKMTMASHALKAINLSHQVARWKAEEKCEIYIVEPYT